MTYPFARLAIMAILLITGLSIVSQSAHAIIAQRTGWVILTTKYSYTDLIERLDKAAADNKIGVVTRASATAGAKAVLDKDIPGNMVVGLYHPRFAVPMLEASVAAGIEAPIRVYISEETNGTTTLAYKKPSFVFAPYMDEGGEKLKKLAEELDLLFAKLTLQAAGQN